MSASSRLTNAQAQLSQLEADAELLRTYRSSLDRHDHTAANNEKFVLYERGHSACQKLINDKAAEVRMLEALVAASG